MFGEQKFAELRTGLKHHVYLHLLRGLKKEEKKWGGGLGDGVGVGEVQLPWRCSYREHFLGVYLCLPRREPCLQITRIANDGCQRLQDRVRLEDSGNVKT